MLLTPWENGFNVNYKKLEMLTCHWVLYDSLSFLSLEVSCLFVVEELFPHQECL